MSQKLALIDSLESAGADIIELNTVRKQFSMVKGGRLAAALPNCPAVSLIISDVVGDPLDVIASGPTVQNSTSVLDAIEILNRRCGSATPRWASDYLNALRVTEQKPIPTSLENVLIGSNEIALAASTQEATRLGYSVFSLGASNTEDVALHAQKILDLLRGCALRSKPVATPACILSGGEPSVVLAPKQIRGRGGRNQQLLLHMLNLMMLEPDLGAFSFLSAGSDGEDGPTDAAGAILDQKILQAAKQLDEDPEAYLERNDAYTYLSKINALLRTGPTNTNVMDLRVAICR